MIPVSTFDGKRVALFGLGGSGLVTAHALAEGGCAVLAWDDNPQSVQKAAEAGINTANLREIDWAEIDALILAPGVPLTHPMPHWTVEFAKKHNVEIIGDVELFARELNGSDKHSPLIAITGTNGKSTTTALIAHVLASAGRDVQMGGNIGRAVLDLDPISRKSDSTQVYVVECSSYQIDLAPNLRPDVGLLLNLTPDHLERHGTIKNYAAIKERLVAGSDLAIVGVDDEFCRTISKRLVSNGNAVETISLEDLSSAAICFDGEALMSSDGSKLATLTGIGSLRGRHNGQNAAAAYAACRDVGLSSHEIETGFRSFPGLAHRMEQVGTVGDVLYINDSKATNAEAAAPALNSFAKVRWIAGGLAKDGGIEALMPYIDRITKAYLIGEAAPLFASQLVDTIPYEISGTLQQAVNHAAADAAATGEREVILLSPAAASFDQFPNFEKRGDAFKQAVQDLDGFKAIES